MLVVVILVTRTTALDHLTVAEPCDPFGWGLVSQALFCRAVLWASTPRDTPSVSVPSMNDSRFPFHDGLCIPLVNGAR